jgi:hypothetical protein
VHARVPLDVDLEDKLLYGLTPTRLAYLIVGLLAAFATWSAHWAHPIVRASAAILIGGVGAVAAWGRWRRRSVDSWAVDLFLFAVSNYRLRRRLPRRRRRR